MARLKSYESFLGEVRLTAEEVQARQLMRSRKKRVMVVSAALLALFPGALDALVVGAAMPTIVSELGGLHLYSWVFSSYLLTRTISLPVFGKLCDLLSSRKLYLFAIFSLSAYMPLFIQGALGKTPAQLGLAMIPLSLGWSGGALVCGQLINRAREKPFSLFGAILLMTGAGVFLSFLQRRLPYGFVPLCWRLPGSVWDLSPSEPC